MNAVSKTDSYRGMLEWKVEFWVENLKGFFDWPTLDICPTGQLCHPNKSYSELDKDIVENYLYLSILVPRAFIRFGLETTGSSLTSC